MNAFFNAEKFENFEKTEISTAAEPLLTAFDNERGVATLTLNRPERCNALSFELARRLLAELRRLAADGRTRLVLLRGAGAHFCGGLDLREATFGAPIPLETLENAGFDRSDFVDFSDVGGSARGENVETVPRFCATPRLVQEIMRQIRRTPIPVVVRACGAACGGGAGIVCAADFVVADSSFRAAFTETKRGLSPTLLFPFLRRKLPISALQEFVLTATSFDAERAREVGIVQRLVAPEALDSAVDAAISNFLANAPESLRAAKRLFSAELTPSDAETLDGWREHCRAWASDAGREGIAAFLEKRRPNWEAENA